MPQQFERYFAQEQMREFQAPRVPIRAIADVGGAEVPGAMEELGEDTSAIVAKWYEREGNSQLDTAVGETRKLIGDFERTSFADADTHDAEYKKLKAAIGKLTPKNKSGAKKFKSWMGLREADWEKISAEKKIRMINQNNQMALFDNLTNVARDYTDPVEAKKRINTLIQGGLDDGTIKTASQAFAMKKRFTDDWEKYQKQVMLDGLHEAAKEMPYNEAISYLNDIEGLTREERNDLIARRKRQEEIDTASTNPDVYMDTLRSIINDPESITEEELAALVKPDSLTAADYEKFVKMKTTGSPLSKPIAKRGIAIMDRLRTVQKGMLDDEAEDYLEQVQQVEMNILQATNDLENWLLKNPNATSKQIEDEINYRTKPVKEEIALGFMNRLFFPKKGHWLSKIIGSEEEILVNKKLRALKKLPEWEGMSDAEKASAKRAFEQGRTLDEVVRLL